MTRDTAQVGGGRAPAASGRAAAIAAGAAGQAGSENFPVALRLLPRRPRRHLAAVYAYARTVDDIGDTGPAAERPALLDELAADVDRLYAGADGGDGGPRLAVVAALAPAVAECGIPAAALHDLIEANRQDQVVTRYQTFDDLLSYCRLSANPVGRLVLHIFGAATAEREVLSDRVCSALQVAEHLQDVAEDLRSGRIYLPAEDMERFGCSAEDLAAPTAGPAVRALIAFEQRRARGLLDQGAPIIATLRGAARLAVAGYVAGGRAALAAIAASGYDVLVATPRAGKAGLVGQVLTAYVRGR